MKATTRLIRVKNETHKELSRLGNEMGFSMAAVIALGVESLKKNGAHIRPASNHRYGKGNVRTAVKRAHVK